MIRIQLSYYATLRDLTGIAAESMATEQRSIKHLFAELKAKYQWSLDLEHVIIAVNDDVATVEQVLNEGDHVVFMPPYSGG